MKPTLTPPLKYLALFTHYMSMEVPRASAKNRSSLSHRQSIRCLSRKAYKVLGHCSLGYTAIALRTPDFHSHDLSGHRLCAHVLPTLLVL